MKPQEFFLSNGIPVIIQHCNSPVGTFHWWNLTGSTDELPHEAGYAHFLEHMLFKDAAAKETGQASTGKTARAIESLGGEINAYTSFDQTVYHVTCSEQHWEQVIDQFGIMAKPQKFLRQDFEREREVILEELRRGQDSPDRQLYEKLFSLTYKSHPYGKPVIGFEKTLKQATVQKLEAFYRRNYVSGQMGLVLAGPVGDPEGKRLKGLLKILEKRFGSRVIPKRPALSKKRLQENVAAKPRAASTPFDVKNPELALSYRTVDIHHTDVAALDVLAGILGMGESSRLYQRFFYEKSLVTDCSASVYIPKDLGMFLVSFELKNTPDSSTVLNEYFEMIKDIQENGASKEEIERVVTNIESEKLYSTQTVDGVASRLGYLKFNIGDLNYHQEYLDHIKSVNSSTLKRVAQTYLTQERLSAVLLQPKEEAPATPNLNLSPSSTKTKIEKTIKKQDALEPELIELKNGLKVAYAYRPESSVFSIYLSSWGGTRKELTLDPSLWGVSHLIANTWTKGTESKSSKEMSAIIEGCAASFDGFSGRNTLGLQMTGLHRDWEKLSTLFLETLTKPSFAEDELAHAKRVTEDMIKSITDHSSQVCSKLFMENLFEDHPYGKHPLGSLEQVQKLTRADLQRTHRDWVCPNESTLSLVGGIPPEELHQFLLTLANVWSKQAHPQHQLKNSIEPQGVPTGPRWAKASFGREQTHIMIGSLGLSLQDEERYALRIAQTILGGQSGRLFIELREKRSMAYSVSPMNMEGIEPGYFGVYIGCAPSKTEEAIQGIHAVMEDLAKKGPTAAEMNRAINHYLGQRAMDQQSMWSQASHFGLELLYRGKVIGESELSKSIKKVKPKDVQNVVKKLFVSANKVTVTVS